MTSKKGDRATTTDSRPVLRIGSRVRCADDGVAGRIVWANAVSVKIKWDDGEQVTWRRDSLAERPIEILDPAADEQPAAAMAAPAEGEQTAPTDSPRAEMETALSAPETAATESAPSDTEPATTDGTTKSPTKPKRRRKEPVTPKEKKLSALDAAAQVLAETGQAMSCPEMIAAMAAKDYWTSPGGKTPQATLYSALAREITTKGAASRFVKAGRGKFALANGQQGVGT